jgi:hypothetical protein
MHALHECIAQEHEHTAWELFVGYRTGACTSQDGIPPFTSCR